MKRYTKTELEEMNKKDGYHPKCSRCPFCGEAIGATGNYAFNFKIEEYTCKKHKETK